MNPANSRLLKHENVGMIVAHGTRNISVKYICLVADMHKNN